jgi:hypothetical protein
MKIAATVLDGVGLDFNEVSSRVSRCRGRCLYWGDEDAPPCDITVGELDLVKLKCDRCVNSNHECIIVCLKTV